MSPPSPPTVSDGRQRLDREAGFLTNTDEDLTDYHKSSKLSELYSATVPSIDSAMSSWDSSGFDAGYSSQGRPDGTPAVFTAPLSRVCSDGRCWFSGTFLHKASDLLLNPNEWHRNKHRSQTAPGSSGLLHHSAMYDGRFTEDEWDALPG